MKIGEKKNYSKIKGVSYRQSEHSRNRSPFFPFPYNGNLILQSLEQTRPVLI